MEVTRDFTADSSARAVAGAVNIILKDAPMGAQRGLCLGCDAVRPTRSINFTYGQRHQRRGGLVAAVAISAQPAT